MSTVPAANYPVQLVINGRNLGSFDNKEQVTHAIVSYQMAAVGEGFCPVHERGLAADGRCPVAHHAWRVTPVPPDDWRVEEVCGAGSDDLETNMRRYWGADA